MQVLIDHHKVWRFFLLLFQNNSFQNTKCISKFSTNACANTFWSVFLLLWYCNKLQLHIQFSPLRFQCKTLKVEWRISDLIFKALSWYYLLFIWCQASAYLTFCSNACPKNSLANHFTQNQSNQSLSFQDYQFYPLHHLHLLHQSTNESNYSNSRLI